jgi:hypothetical protein
MLSDNGRANAKRLHRDFRMSHHQAVKVAYEEEQQQHDNADEDEFGD